MSARRARLTAAARHAASRATRLTDAASRTGVRYARASAVLTATGAVTVVRVIRYGVRAVSNFVARYRDTIIVALVAASLGGVVYDLHEVRTVVRTVKVVQRQQGADEHATCVIQARGLPASHHLAGVMEAINVLIQPVNPKLPGAKELPPPPPLPRYYRPAVTKLRKELPEYLRPTRRQPSGRRC